MAKRRGNGEGNIRKRKDGRWEGRYSHVTDQMQSAAAERIGEFMEQAM